jgi:ribonuclease HII
MLKLKQEQAILSSGYKYLGSIDEAGRGPLAGPVVAACVVMGPEFNIRDKRLKLIKDSKRLTEKKREEIYEIIYELFGEIGIGICDHKTIDRINILQASFLAMKKAIGALKQKPDYVILDGKWEIPNFSLKQTAIIKGDNRVLSIAAASVIAKVARDRIMHELHELHPQYGFNQHKGYGTKLHFAKLNEHGPSPVHRSSFKPVKKLIKKIIPEIYL